MSTPLYPNLGLNRNPFEISAEYDVLHVSQILEDVKRFCLDIREKEYNEIKKRFLDPLTKPESGRIPENLWIKGEKGVGKSILLKKLVFDLFGNSEILTIYIKVPEAGLDLNGIYNRSIEWLGIETFQKISQKVYEKYFSEIDLSEAVRVLNIPMEHLNDLLKKIKENLTRQPEALYWFFDESKGDELRTIGIEPNMIKRNALIYRVSAKLIVDFKMHKKFADLIAAFPSDPLGVFTKMKNIKGKEVVPFLISLYKSASLFLGTKALVIILDEFEISWRKMKERDRIATVVAIRALHDSSQGRIKFIVTVIDEVFELLPQDKYRHILDVIPKTVAGSNVIDVTQLSSDQAIKLVEFLLNQPGVRIKKASYIHPFTPEVIYAVNNKTGGITRDLIVELRHILDKAEEQGAKVIDADVLLKISPDFQNYLP